MPLKFNIAFTCLTSFLFFSINSVQSKRDSNTYVFTTWNNWPRACSRTCGRGLRCRVRVCKNLQIDKEVAGSFCSGQGKPKECQPCIEQGMCPVHGSWGGWSVWSRCYFPIQEANGSNVALVFKN